MKIIWLQKYNNKIKCAPFVFLEFFLNHIVPMNSKTIINMKTTAPTITPPMIPPMMAPDKLSSL